MGYGFRPNTPRTLEFLIATICTPVKIDDGIQYMNTPCGSVTTNGKLTNRRDCTTSFRVCINREGELAMESSVLAYVHATATNGRSPVWSW